MNNTRNKKGDIPDAILELLPWYMINNLSEDDKATFENALQTYPALQMQLKEEQEVITLVSKDKSLLNKRVIASPEERLKSVFNAIDNPKVQIEESDANESNVGISLTDRIKNTLSSFLPSPQYAAFAGIAVLAVSVAILVPYLTQEKSETNAFSLASADAPTKLNEAPIANVSKAVLLVGFKGNKEELSSNDVLKGKLFDIAAPADSDGFFQISFKQAMNADELKHIVEALLAQEETVWFAGEAF